MDEVVEAVAGDVVHGDIGQVVLFADVVDGDDMRMAKAPGGLRLLKEALAHRLQLATVELVGQRQGLDGHGAADARVAAQIHRAHGAAAQLVFDLVAAQQRAFHLGIVDDQGGVQPAAAGQRRRAGAAVLVTALGDIAEFRLAGGDMVVDRQRTAELAAALVFQPQLIQGVEAGSGRQAAQGIEGRVQLALVAQLGGEGQIGRLGLRRQPRQARGDAVMGGEQRLPQQQVQGRQAQRQPQVFHHQPQQAGVDGQQQQHRPQQQSAPSPQAPRQQQEIEQQQQQAGALDALRPARHPHQIARLQGIHHLRLPLHRRHVPAARRHHVIAQVRRGNAQQHDAVAQIGRRHAALQQVFGGKQRQRLVLRQRARIHAQGGIGGDEGIAQAHPDLPRRPRDDQRLVHRHAARLRQQIQRKARPVAAIDGQHQGLGAHRLGLAGQRHHADARGIETRQRRRLQLPRQLRRPQQWRVPGLFRRRQLGHQLRRFIAQGQQATPLLGLAGRPGQHHAFPLQQGPGLLRLIDGQGQADGRGAGLGQQIHHVHQPLRLPGPGAEIDEAGLIQGNDADTASHRRFRHGADQPVIEARLHRLAQRQIAGREQGRAQQGDPQTVAGEKSHSTPKGCFAVCCLLSAPVIYRPACHDLHPPPPPATTTTPRPRTAGSATTGRPGGCPWRR